MNAWSAILSQALIEAGTAPGTPDRIAIPMADDDLAAKRVLSELVSAAGFGTVDAGALAKNWRIQPGSPAYYTELTITESQALARSHGSEQPGNVQLNMSEHRQARISNQYLAH
ncbi:hypothetical protein [Agrobacterium fabrum]|uniref:hypothetical protein n=1 Tax=Agrobacterium fabrum TaxID=1176649 RepID=UPI001574AB45|nr:hypothetical protein [Agrobacterium fabrum]WCK80173.1 hypothetical protein G6L39_025750 [Agrobacterium fabrum]